MTLPASIPDVCINTIVSLLVPMVRSAAGNDEDAARALALDILSEYEPRNGKELLVASEAAAFKISQIRLQMEAMASTLTDKEREAILRNARKLGRSSKDAHRALRRSQGKR